MNCRNCGSQLPDGAKFCPTCGAVQSADTPSAQGFPPPQNNVPPQGYAPPQPGPVAQQPYGSAQQPPYYAPQQSGAPVPPAEKKKMKKGTKALIVIPAILLGLVILAVAAFLLNHFLFPKPGPLPEPTALVTEATTAAPVPATTEPTDAPETTAVSVDTTAPVDGVQSKYSPGNYIQHTLGSITLYLTPDSDWEDSLGAEAPAGELGRIVVTEVRQNQNADYAFEVWRGKTTIDGKTGWVDLYYWTCTDLKETALTKAEEDFVFQKLQGAWRFYVGDQLIEFSENENGRRWVTATENNTDVIYFSCEVSGTLYGDPNGLVRIPLITGQGYERELLVDLTPAAKSEIMWCFENENWTYAYYDGTSIEDAGPHGGGAH